MTLSQLFDHNDSEQITQIVINQLKATMPGEFYASKLLKQLNALDKPF